MTARKAMTPREQDACLRRIGTALLATAPQGWRKLRLVYSGLVDSEAIHVDALMEHGRGVGCVPPFSVLGELRDLRAGMFAERTGTWYTAYYEMERPARYRVRYDHESEPYFDEPRGEDSYLLDLEHFPRDREHIPDWLLERLDGGRVPEPASRWSALATSRPSRKARIAPGEMDPEEVMDTIQEIAARTTAAVRGEWREVVVEHRALVGVAASKVRVLREEGEEWDLLLPEVAHLFRRLRTGMYHQGKGTWYTFRLTVKESREIGVHYDLSNPPEFDVEPDPRSFYRDAMYFPRSADHLPDWLLDRLSAAQRMMRGTGPGRSGADPGASG
ncbi:hypothetical protein ACOALZ_03960 [Nocardiopsis algeriensis]|uniref:hypothetical protein n=1 Tax=Nocardiopsis algeriensis TaxID=1478215 RepID=UPI003B42810A